MATESMPKSYRREEGEDDSYTASEVRKTFTVQRKYRFLNPVRLPGDRIRIGPIESDETYETLEVEYRNNAGPDLDVREFVDHLYDYLEDMRATDETEAGARTGI